MQNFTHHAPRFTLFLLTLTLAHLLTFGAKAYYGDIAADRESFTLGIAGQNANQITSLTALFPIESANGWAGAYVSRQVADGMVVSETYNGHLQGGFKVRGIGVEAYAAATRDKWRAIDLAIETGYFIRPGTFTWNNITFSGGAGNYTERRTEDAEIGREAGDPSTTFGWLAFISGKWRNVSGVLRYKPSLDFEETKFEGSLSFNHELSETVSLGITTQGVLDSQSIAESDFHSSYLIQFTYTPGE